MVIVVLLKKAFLLVMKYCMNVAVDYYVNMSSPVNCPGNRDITVLHICVVEGFLPFGEGQLWLYVHLHHRWVLQPSDSELKDSETVEQEEWSYAFTISSYCVLNGVFLKQELLIQVNLNVVEFFCKPNPNTEIIPLIFWPFVVSKTMTLFFFDILSSKALKLHICTAACLRRCVPVHLWKINDVLVLKPAVLPKWISGFYRSVQDQLNVHKV